MYCAECNSVGSKHDSKYCARCGKELIESEIMCPHGGELNPHKASIWDKFCGVCGKPIQEEIQEHIKRERERERGGEKCQ